MATLESIIIENCPMPNIVCWSRKTIHEVLCELRKHILELKNFGYDEPTRRFVCRYLGADIDAMLVKICVLEKELMTDDIVTPEFRCFIIEALTDLTRRQTFMSTDLTNILLTEMHNK